MKLKTWLLIILALLVGAALAYIWTLRAAIQKGVEKRKLLGGVVGAVEDAGSLYDDVKTIWGNLGK